MEILRKLMMPAMLALGALFTINALYREGQSGSMYSRGQETGTYSGTQGGMGRGAGLGYGMRPYGGSMSQQYPMGVTGPTR